MFLDMRVIKEFEFEFPYIFGDEGMDAAAIQAAVRRFRFERFDKMGEEWEYYIQRFETELALHGLLEGNETANIRRNLLLSKIGRDAFKVVVDHYRPEDVATITYVALK